MSAGSLGRVRGPHEAKAPGAGGPLVLAGATGGRSNGRQDRKGVAHVDNPGMLRPRVAAVPVNLQPGESVVLDEENTPCGILRALDHDDARPSSASQACRGRTRRCSRAQRRKSDDDESASGMAPADVERGHASWSVRQTACGGSKGARRVVVGRRAPCVALRGICRQARRLVTVPPTGSVRRLP